MIQDNGTESKKTTTFIDDYRTGILHERARKLSDRALATEIELFINQYKELKNRSERSSAD